MAGALSDEQAAVLSTDARIVATRELRDWMLANAEQEECAGAVQAHLAGYATDEQIEGWIALYRDVVVPAIPGFEGSTGVDFGCWTGIGTSILASFGAARVFGAEVNAATMRFGPRWAERFGHGALRFAWNAAGVIPLPSRSVDWVYVNQVFCNMDPEGFDQAVGEIARVLRRDGRLVFCDSNNPHCPATLERLERVYRTRELGDGDAANPAGVLHKQRAQRVRQLVTGASEDEASRIAGLTCYMGGEELDRAILLWHHSGSLPGSPFLGGWRRAPVSPATGMAAGNITDPFDLAARFERAGLSVSINTAAAEGPGDPGELLERMMQSQSFYIIGRKR